MAQTKDSRNIFTGLLLIIVGIAVGLLIAKPALLTNIPFLESKISPTLIPAPTTIPLVTTPTTAISQNGTINGRLCYPSDFLPPGEIIAKDTTSGKLYSQGYIGTTKGGKTTYYFPLPAGTYNLRYEAHASLTKPDIFTSGYYTKCSVAQDTCRETNTHKMIPVSLQSGQNLEGIDLCDFYYGQFGEPKF